MDRYDPYTDKFLRDTQYDILSTNLAEVGTDCISRQAAIDELVKMLGYCFQADEELVDAVVTTVRELPAAQPEPKKGAWINEGRIIRCNRCKIGYATVKGMKSALTYKFCPNCGSYNGGEQDG